MRTLGLVLLLILSLSVQVLAGGDVDTSTRLEAMSAVSRSTTYLLRKQEVDGSFSKHPGVTAMAVIALAESPRADDADVKRAVTNARAFLLSKIDDKGRITGARQEEDIYSTSVCLMALSVADQPGDDAICRKLRNALVKSQLRKPGEFGYGGATFGYTASAYPDLSNTHWALEAIRLTQKGITPETMKLWRQTRAFVTSCQILKSDDPKLKGGFLYYPVGKAPAKRAHDKTDVVWGSLTLGALKVMLFAGIPHEDKRIADAVDWLGNNFSLKENPGLGQGGYYYYCYMYSSGMLFLEAGGVKSEKLKTWRSELADQLLSRQKNGDHWVNDNRLWLESDPVLCTAYAMKALYFTLKDMK